MHLLKTGGKKKFIHHKHQKRAREAYKFEFSRNIIITYNVDKFTDKF